jgi:hypothetical protein
MSLTADNPQGFLRDAQGRMVPESMVKPIDRTRDDLVRDLVRKAEELSTRIAAFKADALSEVQAFIELSAGEYGVSVGGKKGNVTLTSFDGDYKLQRAIAEHIAFDERLQVAKELIDQCINEWSEGSRDEIRVLINDAFQVDREGKVSTYRILSLRRLDIDHDKWSQAMTAISDSIRTTGSKTYVRLYKREGAAGEYRPIKLDVAAL